MRLIACRSPSRTVKTAIASGRSVWVTISYRTSAAGNPSAAYSFERAS